MGKHRGGVLWLLVLFLVAACQQLPTPKSTLRWTGEALEGAVFATLTEGAVQVHYADPTSQEIARGIAGRVQALCSEWDDLGIMESPRQIDLWLVPADVDWPQNLAAPPYDLSARAAGPNVVVMRAKTMSPEEVRRNSGLPEALAVALTQQAGSPVFTVDWLHEGMGTVWSQGWTGFPVTYWYDQERKTVFRANELLTALTATQKVQAADARQAASALATLVMDRWGVAWPQNYARSATDLTPMAALRWTTGGTTDTQATRLWQERMDYMSQLAALQGEVSKSNVATAADESPVRVEPPSVAGQGQEPNDNYSPTAYELRAVYEPSRRSVNGTEVLVWQNGEGVPIDTLYFNLWPNSEQYAMYGGGIVVTAVQVDGQAVPFMARGLDLVVPLGRPVAPGEQAKITTQFTTTLPASITRRVLGQDGERRFNLAHWFPILAVLDDRGWNLHPLPLWTGEPYSENSRFHVWLDLPAGTQVAATGHQVAATTTGERLVYEYDAPNVRDWVATGGRGLAEADLVVGGVTIHSIESDPNWVREAAADTANVVELFTSKFGPYPYKDLVVTCCAGLEYPGLFYSMGTDPGEFWKVATYHEAAHQWFFSLVGNDQYDEPWLDEGFARYGERLALRTFGPKSQLRELKATVLLGGLHVSSSSAAYDAIPGSNYAQGVYNMGALALEDLENLIGPELFSRLMHEWVRQYQFKIATTGDFIALASQISGRPLTDFFAQHRIFDTDRGSYSPIIPVGKVKP